MEWQKGTPQEILKQMIQHKLSLNYERPSFMDISARILLIVPGKSSCLFAEIGALIIDEKAKRVLASGYNGPPSGCENCFEVGCARVVNGEIKKGENRCRGLHGELNTILHTTRYGIKITGLSMFCSFKPCYDCAKIIANSGLVRVFYLFEYHRQNEDNRPKDVLEKAKIELVKYESEYLLGIPEYRENKKIIENF